jgi:ABC-2 type transport system permease protein
MTMPTDAVEPPFQASAAAPTALAATRPFYWSVRREIWENRSLYIAPAIAAGVVLFGFLIGLVHFSRHFSDLDRLPADQQAGIRLIPYAIAAAAITVTSLIVAVTYTLGALHNERRDRSVLFWKSLPVSDLTAVLAKAAIPTAVLPAIAFAIIVATDLVVLLFHTLGVGLHGQSVAALWGNLPLLHFWGVLAYAIVTGVIWNAPIAGWLLLVSAWARRAPFLWAVLPPLALCLIEKIAFDTSNLAGLLKRRLTGAAEVAFSMPPHGGHRFEFPGLDLVGFMTSPEVWLGVVFAAACVAGAVWLRRRREPI